MTERSTHDGGGDGDDGGSNSRVVVVPDSSGTTGAGALWAIRTEARDALEMTAGAIEAKDDKALATVRINLVLVGVTLTALSSFPSTVRPADWVTLLGVGSLAVSTGLGILTYSGTDYPPGVGPDYLADARAASYTEAEWLAWMVSRYEDWTAEAIATYRMEATLLRWTHFAQALGVLTLAVAFSSGVVESLPRLAAQTGLGAAVFFCVERR